MCRSCLRGVAWFSYWFDNLGLITEGNTYRCYTASSLPLWENTDVVLANINSLGEEHQIEQDLVLEALAVVGEDLLDGLSGY